METFVHSHPHFYPSINVLQLKLVFAMKRVVAVGKHMPAGGKGRTEVGIGDGGWGKLSIEGVFSVSWRGAFRVPPIPAGPYYGRYWLRFWAQMFLTDGVSPLRSYPIYFGPDM